MARYKKMSLKPDPEFPYKGSAKYFRTQEEATAYSEFVNLQRRAKRAGFGTTPKELQEYKKAEEVRLNLAERERQLKAKERAERDRIREEHGLHPRAHVTGVYATIKVRDEGVRISNQKILNRMSDAQKLESIRKLYTLNISKDELIQRIAFVAGVPR